MDEARQIVQLFFDILIYLVIARVILSWISLGPGNPIARIIYEITEPLLAPFRRLMPKTGMPIDFSPILVIFTLHIIRNFIVGYLI